MSPLSIYIHWPFCKSKCPYCDFNSHVRDNVDHARWRAALLSELGYWAQKFPGRTIVSVFFGGGTPSLMQPDTVQALLDAIRIHWPDHKDMEITLEANPTSVEAANFKVLAAAGVNRVSLGVQALNAADLKFLGREHNVGEALDAIVLAREHFPRMSFDLIYARPGQSIAAWEQELAEALTLTKGHLSLYQLTIEENTAFHTAYKKGQFQMPSEDVAADMYILTQQMTESYGLPAYEISNHAAPGHESRHNIAYWQSDDAIGIGPGAHGRYSVMNNLPLDGGGRRAAGATGGGDVTDFTPLPNPPPQGGRGIQGVRFLTETIKSPERWLEKVETSGTGLIAEHAITPEEHTEEAIMMGLRLSGGIRFADWQERSGVSLQEKFSAPAIRKLVHQSLIIADDDHIRTTLQGRLLLNSITRELLAS